MRAWRNGIEGVRDGAIIVGVTSPPVEGAANAAVIEVLAQALERPKTLSLCGAATSRAISGLAAPA